MAEDKKFEWALPKGTRLNGGTYPYEIVSCLGHGGFGITYKVKARIPLNNIEVDVFFALKEYFPTGCWRDDDRSTVLYSRALEDDMTSGLSDFISEGNRLQKICNVNPNIVNVNEVFRDNGTAYFVMEYLSGGDLRELVRQNGGGLSQATMLSILTPIASAIESLHEAHVLHLDIKPENIVMRSGEDGAPDVPVLIDFGISVHFNEAGEPTTARPSKGVTQGYSPVEQFAGITCFDPRYDVYSLSATCYYVLTGHDPKNAFDVTESDIRYSLQGLANKRVVDAIVRGMSKEKAARTPSVAELIADLTRNDEDDTAENNIPRYDDSWTINMAQRAANIEIANRGSRAGNDVEKKPKAKNRKKWLLVAAGLALLAIVGGFILGSVLMRKSLNDNKNSGEVSLQDTVYSEELLKKAQDGDAQAQDLLAFCYYYGLGITANYNQAVYWCRKAADQGYAESQYRLGICYYYGDGIEKDYTQAVYWWRKSAEQGYADAQYNLGASYHDGEGVTQDYSQAVYWYRKAAEQGDALAQYNLGDCYENGKGVTQDYSQAVYWYRKAAEQGDDYAQCVLGACYYEGNGVSQDYSQAVYWWRKSAEQGNAHAQNNLGNCYEYGEGVIKDISQAVEWYRKAARQGNAMAQYNFGLCYENGNGVTRDINQAVEWYQQSARQNIDLAQQALARLGYSW